MWYTDNVIIMKDNTGFTLIELILVIGIMGVLSLVVGMSINKMMEGQNEKEYNEFKKVLEDAACVYAESSPSCLTNAGCYINYGMLIETGLIKKDLMNPNKDYNPEKKTVNDPMERAKTIRVYINAAGEKICEYSEQ